MSGEAKGGVILKDVNIAKKRPAASYLPTVEVRIIIVGVQLAADSEVVRRVILKR